MDRPEIVSIRRNKMEFFLPFLHLPAQQEAVKAEGKFNVIIKKLQV